MKTNRLLGATLLSILALSACSKESPKLTMPPLAEYVVDDDATTVEFAPGVDILFVVDNSGSMSTHQQNLANNVARFTASFQNAGQLDYHIGVITTDMDEGGRLRGTTKYVDRNTVDGMRILSDNLLAGTDGSPIEAVFEPSISALSPMMQTGWNAGFYREDAILALVFITDAEDQSRSLTGDMALQQLINMKKGDASKVLAYGAIAVSGVPDSVCPRDSGEPRKIESFLGKVVNAGKNVFSLCDPSFGDQLARIGDDLADRIGNVILLKRPPDLKTVVVQFGTQIIAKHPTEGWSFDPERNAIILGPEIPWTQQPKGTKLKVTFSAAKFENKH